MKATELRIGNLVYENYGGDYIVREILDNGKILISKTYSTIAVHYKIEELKPIGITGKRLRGFGFKENGYTYTKGNFLIWDYDTSGIFYFMLLDKRDLLEPECDADYIVYSKEICKIQYMHELQNIWLDLNKEELNP